jgi:hypothetical protein
VKCFRILRFGAVIEIYNKMSEIQNFWLLALILQMRPYLIFILVSKSAYFGVVTEICGCFRLVNMVLSSQNALDTFTYPPHYSLSSCYSVIKTIMQNSINCLFDNLSIIYFDRKLHQHTIRHGKNHSSEKLQAQI